MPLRTRRPVLSALALVLLTAGLPATAQQADAPAGAYLAARVAASENDFRESARWYDIVLESGVTSPALLEGAIIANLGLGQMDRAADLSRRLLQTGGQSQSAAIAILADQAKRDDYRAILADFEAGATVGKLLDSLVTSWSALGDGRMSDAIDGFDTIAKSPGLEAFGLYHKALALASAGDFEGADAILSGQDSGTIAVTRRGIIAHVQILSQLERNADALALIDRSFGPEPDPQLDALRAKLKTSEVLPFDIVRTATDGIAEVFFTLATALQGEADDAYTLIYARVVTDLRPDHSEAALLAAELLERLNQPALAGETYASIRPEDPAYYIAEIGRANTLVAAGKADAGLEVLQTLARSHGNIVAVQMALGDALRRNEDFADAIPAYDAAIKLIANPDPRHWGLFYTRGICHERIGQWDKAEADFRTALKLSPDQPQVLNYLGYSFVDRGENLDEALAMIERAVAAQPDAGYIIDSLAWAYFRLGRYADAVAPMERASLLEPVDAVVTDHLGDVYWAVGRKLEARFQWHRALSFDPEPAEADRIRRKLDVGLDAVLAEEGAKPLTEVANGD